MLNLNRLSGSKTVVNLIGQIISGMRDLMIASKTARIYFDTDSGSSFQIFLVACLMQIIKNENFRDCSKK